MGLTTAVPAGTTGKRSILWKLFGCALLLLIVAAIAAVAWFHRATREALPQIDGAIALPTLKEPVEVVRDAQGVPHIRAKTIDDLLFAQGYVTAQDRLWQMDILRRLAAGELSEIEGKSALPIDKRQRVLQIRNASAAILAALSARDRHFLEAYSSGVNAYIQPLKHLPVEFRILRYRPAPWTPLDCLLVAANLHQYLGTRYTVELSREKMLARVTPEEFAELYPNRSQHDHPPGVDGPELRGVTSTRLRQSSDVATRNVDAALSQEKPSAITALDSIASDNFLTPIALALSPFSNLQIPERCDDCVPGSNNWVVSGKHTASGKPLLSNDMHLQHSIPGIWYEAQLSLDGASPGERPFDVAGVTLPGLPFVIVGHNQRIAWGYTNLGPDVQDVYVESTNSHDQYQTPNGWHNMDYAHEVIHVHGASDVVLQVPLTRHGPVISSIIPGESRTLALKWTYYDPHAVGLPLYDLDTASNWQEFREALKFFGSPSQNAVYADIDGHIGYQACGAIPLRRSQSNLLPVPGNDDAHEWTGYIPFEQLPSVYDPPSGVLATANGRIAPDNYPYLLATEWFAPYRAERIYQLLAAKQRMTPADMLHIQTDIYSSVDHFVAQQFVAAIGRSSLASERAKEAAGILSKWDGEISSDSAAPTLAVKGREALWQIILKAKLGADWEDYQWFSSSLALENILTSRAPHWLPDHYKSYDDLLVDAMEKTIHDAPADLATWKYGKIFPVEINHPVLGAIPGLRRSGTGIQPQSGDTLTVKQVKRAFGPSERMTIDFSELDNSTLNIVFGQSGNFGSPYYRNQWAAWYGGTTFPLPFSREAINTAQLHKLTLTPH